MLIKQLMAGFLVLGASYANILDEIANWALFAALTFLFASSIPEWIFRDIGTLLRRFGRVPEIAPRAYAGDAQGWFDMNELAPERRAEGVPREAASSSRTGNASAILTAAIAVAFVLVGYVWIVSLGTWTKWPEAYDYSHYDKLASGFLHGQLFLQEAPSAELLALSNPFDAAQRGDMPYLIDASLFEGRYYLYFGPVPALLLLPIKVLVPRVVHDVYLVFAFVSALFLTQVIFLLRVRGRLFPGVSSWLLLVSILLLGLTTPYNWILGSQATPHNAAIAAGQFFFLAGLLMAFEALAGKDVHSGKSVAAGLLWSGALGSRVTQVIPIAFVMLFILAHLFHRHGAPRNLSSLLRDLLPFAMPLALGGGALGWYNWARFGSPLETGFSYQLAMLPIQSYAHDLFSIRYVLQNFYNYALNPPRLRYAFPYVWPQIGLRELIVPGLALSPIYFTEENTGLIYLAPFLIWSAAPALRVRNSMAASQKSDADARLLRWLWAALAGSFLSGFALFLTFFWTSNRYVLDFAPPLLMLSIVAFWQIAESLQSRPGARAALIFVGLLLLTFSLVLSAMLTLAQNAGAYGALDPHISRHLRRWFGP